MKKLILLLLTCTAFFANAQTIDLKKHLKFATLYGAVNSGTSLLDNKTAR